MDQSWTRHETMNLLWIHHGSIAVPLIYYGSIMDPSWIHRGTIDLLWIHHGYKDKNLQIDLEKQNSRGNTHVVEVWQHGGTNGNTVQRPECRKSNMAASNRK